MRCEKRKSKCGGIQRALTNNWRDTGPGPHATVQLNKWCKKTTTTQHNGSNISVAAGPSVHHRPRSSAQRLRNRPLQIKERHASAPGQNCGSTQLGSLPGRHCYRRGWRRADKAESALGVCLCAVQEWTSRKGRRGRQTRRQRVGQGIETC